MNQPPQTEKQASKRIVSKGEYMKAQGQRASKGLLGTCLYVAAVVCGLLMVGLVFVLYKAVMLYRQEPTGDISGLMLSFLLIVVLGGGAYVFRQLALNILQQVQEIDPGIPLTRANTADLSAPESLVRASTEPVQEQQTELLRAVTEAQERHEDQLVRAVSKRE